MKWETDLRDILHLSFAVQVEELDRLVPPESAPETRFYQGAEWGFFSLVLFRQQSLRSQWSGWPRLSFNQALLQVYVRDHHQTPAVYIKRSYAGRGIGWLLHLLGTLPTRTMSLNYPGQPRPGGLYRWKLVNGGQVDVRGKIRPQEGLSGSLLDVFDSEAEAEDFLLNRPVAYFSPEPDGVHRCTLSRRGGEPHPVQIEEWELGGLAEDLQRHDFPDALSSVFFVAQRYIDGGNVEKVDRDGLAAS